MRNVIKLFKNLNLNIILKLSNNVNRGSQLCVFQNKPKFHVNNDIS